MVAENKVLQYALLHNEETIFASRLTNEDQNKNQISVDVLRDAVDDLAFSIKSNFEKFAGIYRPSLLSHRLDLDWNRLTICIG